MSDIIKRARYALDRWNLSIGHKSLIEELVRELLASRRTEDELHERLIEYGSSIDRLMKIIEKHDLTDELN